MFGVLAFLLWLFGAAATLGVASLPLGIEAQLALAAGALAAMLALKLFAIRGPFRPVFLGLGTFVILRYLFWRLSRAIPPISSPLDFAAGMVLLLAEIYCISMLFMSLFTVADPIDRPKAPRVTDEDAPTVDVFVPTYNEAIEIVAPTLAAAKRMQHPEGKLNVFPQRLSARRRRRRGKAPVGRPGDGAPRPESARELPGFVRGVRGPLPRARGEQARQGGQSQFRPGAQPRRPGGGLRSRRADQSRRRSARSRSPSASRAPAAFRFCPSNRNSNATIRDGSVDPANGVDGAVVRPRRRTRSRPGVSRRLGAVGDHGRGLATTTAPRLAGAKRPTPRTFFLQSKSW